MYRLLTVLIALTALLQRVTTPSVDVARAARRLADQTTARLADVPSSKQIIADVSNVSGIGTDGNALVYVTWYDTETLAAGYDPAYTPAIGDRVVCTLIDNQLIVQHSIAGTP